MPSNNRSICVFCGASTGRNPAFAPAAAELGRLIAQRGIRLVYGGGSIGLMGAVADGAIAAGGEVVGIITKQLHDREIGHKGVTRLEVVETMHARKARMADLSGAVAVLPGGYGTFDELFEIVAWAQLGLHSKPIGLLNTAGFFDGLMGFLDHADREGFLRLDHRSRLVASNTAAGLLDLLSD